MTTLFSFRGRLRRAPFWKALLAVLTVCVLSGLIVGGWTTALLVLAALWPLLAVSVKRLRDIDKRPVLVVFPLATCIAMGAAGFGLLGFGFFATALMLIPHVYTHYMDAMIDWIFWLSLTPMLAFWLWLGLKPGAAAA